MSEDIPSIHSASTMAELRSGDLASEARPAVSVIDAVLRRWARGPIREDDEAHRAAKRALRIALIALPLHALVAPVYWLYLDAPALGLLITGCGALMCATPLVLVWTGSSRIAGHWLTGTFWLLLTGQMLLAGGIGSNAIYWLPLIALCGMLLAGGRSGWGWAAACVASLLMVSLADSAGMLSRRLVSREQEIAEVFFTAAIGVALTVHIVSQLERQRRSALQALARERARAAHRASHDELTGLPNRRRLIVDLQRAVSRAQTGEHRFGLIHVELHGLATVSDQLGRSAGQTLMARVADRLSAITRETDTLARIGSDEFAMLVEPVGGRANVEFVARRIQQTLGTPFSLMASHAISKVQIGSSQGVALYPDDGEEPEALLEAADTATYRAGRGR